MSTNCLQTKLKVTVDNSNLEKLGEIELLCASNSAYPGINANAANTVLLKVSGGSINGSRERYASSSLGNMGPLTADAGVDVVRISANPKYNLTRLSDVYPAGGLKALAHSNIVALGGVLTRINDALKEAFVFDIDELSAWKDKSLLKTILFANLGFDYHERGFFKGDISTFAAFTNLENLTLTVANVTGDISTLGPCTKLTTLKLYYTFCNGSIESFVQAQRQKGRTTESTGITVNVGNNGERITFNGSSVQGDNTLTWTASTITLGNVTVEG